MSFYRGGIGQWSWALHRATGVAVLLFLLVHILDTALILLGPELYNRVIELYRLPVFGFMEIGLFGAVLYHALNGVRVVLIDFWPGLTVHHKRIFWVMAVLFVGIFLPVSGVMIGHILAGPHG